MLASSSKLLDTNGMVNNPAALLSSTSSDFSDMALLVPLLLLCHHLYQLLVIAFEQVNQMHLVASSMQEAQGMSQGTLNVMQELVEYMLSRHADPSISLVQELMHCSSNGSREVIRKLNSLDCRDTTLWAGQHLGCGTAHDARAPHAGAEAVLGHGGVAD